MKLASYKDGSRDGQLLVVSRDLSCAHYATGIASRLQQVLDDWNFLSPQLQDLSQTLNHGKSRHAFPFDPRLCLAPLARGGLWVEAQPDPKAPGAGSAPLQQGRSDDFLGPRDAIRVSPAGPAPAREAGVNLDFHGQIAVLSGDMARGSGPAAALDGVRLLMLANSLHLEPAGMGLGGALGVAFAPVAATPDELGSAWQGGRVMLTLDLQRNGSRFGQCEPLSDPARHFGDLLACITQHRDLRAGCIVGGGAFAPADGSHGDTCIRRRRQRELDSLGAARTPYLQAGDSLRIEVRGRDGLSVFGAIEQTVEAGR